MHRVLETAGEVVQLEASSAWARRALRELPTIAGGAVSGRPTVVVHAGRGLAPDPARGRRLGRGIVVDRGAVAFRSACSSGADLGVRASADVVEVTADWRAAPKEEVLHRLLPRRAELLAADVLVHYPVLWRAGWRGRVPLHAAALRLRDRGVLVVGASGVGKTTLARAEVAEGAALVSDNLVVSDGETVWGVVEPVRIEGGDGPRTTHGRRLASMAARRSQTRVDLVVVLRRDGGTSGCRPIAPEAATRELVASTYLAGELRRYWGFAAALTAGTGRGPVHPGVDRVAEQVCLGATCFELELGDRPAAHLSHVIDSLEVQPWM
jgi:hypothetical protein